MKCAKTRIIIFLILIFITSTVFSQIHNQSALQSISGIEALYHVKFLSSDEFRGRATFTQEQLIAARYIANEFEKYGLKPISKTNKYYQSIKMDFAEVGIPGRLEIDGKIYEEGKDFQVAPVGSNKLETGVVFAGYGIITDDYNSYENIDVKNKIVMIFEGKIHKKGPQWGVASLHEIRVMQAIKNGAAGMIFVKGTSPRDHKFPIPSKLSFLRIKQIADYAKKLKLFCWNDVLQEKWYSFPMVYISLDIANEILKKEGKTIIELKRKIDSNKKPCSFALKQIVKLETNVIQKKYQAMNVIGLFEGADDILKDETIIIGAHYDHIGVSRDLKKIFNGADDNASGTAALLEIAQAFTKCEIKPKRSILFITFTGEESGCLGSQYYVDNPVIPLSKTIAILNLDMVGRNNPNEIELHCKDENKNLLSISINMSKKIDIALNIPEKVETGGSDHSSFYKKGIPFIFYYDGGGDFAHKSTDTWEKISPLKIEKVARLCFLTACKIANQSFTSMKN
ncbi:hypothetical protein DRQ09_01610 [candidate division KSB1 bacterium]|nr:MAG: hypothetical protein DRQ09_01610 [candidate division KSB1 bacterium]